MHRVSAAAATAFRALAYSRHQASLFGESSAWCSLPAESMWYASNVRLTLYLSSPLPAPSSTSHCTKPGAETQPSRLSRGPAKHARLALIELHVTQPVLFWLPCQHSEYQQLSGSRRVCHVPSSERYFRHGLHSHITTHPSHSRLVRCVCC